MIFESNSASSKPFHLRPLPRTVLNRLWSLSTHSSSSSVRAHYKTTCKVPVAALKQKNVRLVMHFLRCTISLNKSNCCLWSLHSPHSRCFLLSHKCILRHPSKWSPNASITISIPASFRLIWPIHVYSIAVGRTLLCLRLERLPSGRVGPDIYNAEATYHAAQGSNKIPTHVQFSEK
jgi:hypothetical protein